MTLTKQLQRLGGWAFLGIALYAIWKALTVQVDVELCDLNCKNTTESFGFLGGIIGGTAGAILLWQSQPQRWQSRLEWGRRRWRQFCRSRRGQSLIGYVRKGFAVLLVVYAAALFSFNSVPGAEGGCSGGYCTSGGSSVAAGVFYLQIVPVLSIAAWLWWGQALQEKVAQDNAAKSRRFFLVLMARTPDAWIRPTRFAQGAGVSRLYAKAYLSAMAQEQSAKTLLHTSGEVAYQFTPPLDLKREA